MKITDVLKPGLKAAQVSLPLHLLVNSSHKQSPVSRKQITPFDERGNLHIKAGENLMVSGNGLGPMLVSMVNSSKKL